MKQYFTYIAAYYCKLLVYFRVGVGSLYVSNEVLVVFRYMLQNLNLSAQLVTEQITMVTILPF